MSPMHLEVHTLGLSTGLRQTGMPRTEKPSAQALTGRKATAKRCPSQEGQNQSLACRAVVFKELT